MRTMNYYTNKIIEMSFTPLLSFSRKRESRRRLRESWEPEDKKILDARLKISGMTENQARNDRREHICTNNKGVTLIELVITMVLISIIAYIVATALSTGITAYFTTDFRKEALDQARIAMERITREIRNVKSLGRSIDGDGFFDAEIGTASGTVFCFNNLSGNTVSIRYDGSNNIYREEWTPANLATCPGAGGNILAANVTAVNFQYVLTDGTTNPTPADPTDIRRVQVGWSGTQGISVRVNNETVSLSSEVYLRNLQ